MDFAKRLLSRKFLTGLLASGLLVLEKKLGLDLDTDTKLMLVGVAVTWILGESYIDAKALGEPKSPREMLSRLAETYALIKPYLPADFDPEKMLRAALARFTDPSGSMSMPIVEPGAPSSVFTMADPPGERGEDGPAGAVEAAASGFALLVKLETQNNDFGGFAGALGSAAVVKPELASVITGIAGGEAGRVIRMANLGKAPVIFAHLSLDSAPDNRINTGGAELVEVKPGQIAELKYHGASSAWLLRVEG